MVKIDLSERVVLVTGGGDGICRGIAQILSRAGAIVAAADCNLDKLGATTKELEECSGQVLAVAADVSDAAADRLVAKVIEFGGRIDILVNNAGQRIKEL